jgi:hypothetical protein
MAAPSSLTHVTAHDFQDEIYYDSDVDYNSDEGDIDLVCHEDEYAPTPPPPANNYVDDKGVFDLTCDTGCDSYVSYLMPRIGGGVVPSTIVLRPVQVTDIYSDSEDDSDGEDEGDARMHTTGPPLIHTHV